MAPSVAAGANAIEALRALTARVHAPDIADTPKWVLLDVAWPLLAESRRFALAHLEPLLESGCRRANPTVFDHLLHGSFADYPDGYWSRGPISQGVLDTATGLGVITPAEKEVLARGFPDRPPSDVHAESCVDVLAREVECIQRVFSRYAPAQSASGPTRQSSAEDPLDSCIPDPAIGSAEVQAELATKFKGRLERVIDGTLGKILVFRHEPNTIPERVAVKTIDPELVKGGDRLAALRRIRHEVRHWSRYRHSPLILPPLFTAIVHGWPYVAMPYCECTLRDYIDRRVARRSQAEAVALIIQVVSALEYAGRFGLKAHQDLKPENVLLQDLSKRCTLPDEYPFIWRARLSDFGLANAYLELGVPWGSRPYLAPEQYREGSDLAKVDVFACGVMLCEVLTGLHPVGLATSDIWPKPGSDQPRAWLGPKKWRRWAESADKLPSDTACQLGDFRGIVEGAVSTHPGDRPSLRELRDQLLGALGRMDDTSHLSLLSLLARYDLMSVSSLAISSEETADRYEQRYLKELTR